MIRFKAGKNEFAGFKRKQFNNSEKLVIETRKIVTDPCHQRSAPLEDSEIGSSRFTPFIMYPVLAWPWPCCRTHLPGIDTDCLIDAVFWGHFVGCPILGVP